MLIIFNVLIYNFKARVQLVFDYYSKILNYCFPYLPLISFKKTFTFKLLLSTIFSLHHLILLCYLMTHKILSLVGIIAHFENCRWEHFIRKIYFSIFCCWSSIYPEEVKKKKKRTTWFARLPHVLWEP